MPITDRRAPDTAHSFLNPLTILLLFVASVLTWAQIKQRTMMSDAITQAGPEARLIELRWALGGKFGFNPEISSKIPENQWTMAVETVLFSEFGHVMESQERLKYTPEGAFRVCWEAAYNSGPVPSDLELAQVREGLSDGLAYKCLESSFMAKKSHQAAAELRSDALRHYKARALGILAVLIVLFTAALFGIWTGIRMLSNCEPMPDSPDFQMPAIYAVNVCLGWYTVFLLSATVIALMNNIVQMGLWALPAAYLLHAVSGTAFICVAERASPLMLWKKISTKNRLWLSSGTRFLFLALGSVLILTVFLSFFMPDGDAPQRDMVNFIRTNRGIGSFLVIFGTVALLGPFFEEVFFRGFLLSVMRRWMSVWWALAFSSVMFGAIHFQAQALPVLTVLGGVLGLAFVRTNDVKTAIFVHGCWNGGVFLFQKLLY
ncbi:MAG: CPBP family intramembrane metalloprotease [Holophagales bacterium]|jgi:membrane protease YdiL (CAAX protease family)|nr:CPBP family intramembrane metalloprotease [Holophagales bacterium]